jgi:hypothetical protein
LVLPAGEFNSNHASKPSNASTTTVIAIVERNRRRSGTCGLNFASVVEVPQR